MINFKEEIKKINDKASSPHNVHDHLKPLSVEERRVLADNDRLPYAVAMMNLVGDLNTSSILRTAHLCGAKEVFVFGRRMIDCRATVGTQNYLNIHKLGGLNQDNLTIDHALFLKTLKSGDYYPVFVEQGGEFVDEMNWANIVVPTCYGKPCFVFGNEGHGIEEALIERCKSEFTRCYIVSIKQKGVIRSYNVGAAAAIVLHTFCSQAGFW